MRNMIALGAALALTFGCGGAKPPEAQTGPTQATAATPSQQTAKDDKTASSGTVSISEDIRRACGISDTDAYFSFDSAHITMQDIKPLNLVATCFTTGPLKGRAVSLVGHADPRGTSEYNITLGQSRADAVEGYLVRKGVSKGKAASSSRGAMDATGTDESGWARDRRVDVMLGQ
jgi:peptidoglycan-associated lipoprotein